MVEELAEEEWLSPSAAGRALHIHSATLRLHAKRGLVPYAVTPGGAYRYRRSDIEALRRSLDRTGDRSARAVS